MKTMQARLGNLSIQIKVLYEENKHSIHINGKVYFGPNPNVDKKGPVKSTCSVPSSHPALTSQCTNPPNILTSAWSFFKRAHWNIRSIFKKDLFDLITLSIVTAKKRHVFVLKVLWLFLTAGLLYQLLWSQISPNNNTFAFPKFINAQHHS